MCELCDDPELTMDAYVERIRDRLASQRFVVQSVLGPVGQAELSYSIGLTAHGLPELVVAGLPTAEAAPLLAAAGTYLLEESLVLPGETLTSGPAVLEAVEVERPEEHLVLATAVYGPAVRALQLVWADGRGRWPWEPGHRAGRTGQPLLGARSPAYCDEHRPDRLDVPPHP